MKFRRRTGDEPEINLIPFIDVLLVVLIFLMMSTTYSRFTELDIALPTATAEAVKDRPAEIVVVVAADGRYVLDGKPVDGRSVELIAAAMSNAALQRQNPMVVISADASASHQSVINVMDAARRVGLSKLVFAAQKSSP
ncbi:ExbD/TolR family protein [Roseateles sp. BYS180W]|uniref:ExbD/TolR family protein n=1 Tax=Roseateles rivi TaxID=3299028 RepID=A0ABW7FYZ7_9BURK